MSYCCRIVELQIDAQRPLRFTAWLVGKRCPNRNRATHIFETRAGLPHFIAGGISAVRNLKPYRARRAGVETQLLHRLSYADLEIAWARCCEIGDGRADAPAAHRAQYAQA